MATQPYPQLKFSSGWTPITIHFDGVIEPRDLRGKEGFKGRLFAVYPGDRSFPRLTPATAR